MLDEETREELEGSPVQLASPFLLRHCSSGRCLSASSQSFLFGDFGKESRVGEESGSRKGVQSWHQRIARLLESCVDMNSLRLRRRPSLAPPFVCSLPAQIAVRSARCYLFLNSNGLSFPSPSLETRLLLRAQLPPSLGCWLHESFSTASPRPQEKKARPGARKMKRTEEQGR